VHYYLLVQGEARSGYSMGMCGLRFLRTQRLICTELKLGGGLTFLDFKRPLYLTRVHQACKRTAHIPTSKGRETQRFGTELCCPLAESDFNSRLIPSVNYSFLRDIAHSRNMSQMLNNVHLTHRPVRPATQGVLRG